MLLANYKLYCTLQYTVPTKYIVVYWLSTRRCTALFCTVLFAYNILNKIQHCIFRVSDPEPVGSGVFACFGSLSGSGFQISLDPDPVSTRILEPKKSAERALKVIYWKKTLKF